MSIARNDLSLKAAELAGHSPHGWGEFMDALRDYTEQAKNDCILSPADRLHFAQGRAQALLQLLTTLEKARETADRINLRKP